MLIDIHTHRQPQANIWAIQNRYNGFEQLPVDGFFTAGLHPWYITAQGWPQELAALERISNNKNVLAIGECGLDKLCDTGFALQQTVFAAQVRLANAVNKPLIIHCVKAFDEVLQQLRQNKVPVIFHGFNKGRALALQLQQKGYYLSFGRALQQPRMQEVLAALPIDKIFLETDDATVNIEELYTLATGVFQIDINALSLQLQKNAAAVFGGNFL